MTTTPIAARQKTASRLKRLLAAMAITAIVCAVVVVGLAAAGGVLILTLLVR